MELRKMGLLLAVIGVFTVMITLWGSGAFSPREILSGKPMQAEPGKATLQLETTPQLDSSANQPDVRLKVERSDESPKNGHPGLGLANEGLYKGELRDAQRGREAFVNRSARILLGNASHLSPAGGEKSGHFGFAQYQLSLGAGANDALAPTALNGDWIDVEDGRWIMPLPVEDLAILRVVVDDVEFRIDGNRFIAAGDRDGSFYLQKYDLGWLHVKTDNVHVPADRVSVLSALTIPMGKPITIVFGDSSGAPLAGAMPSVNENPQSPPTPPGAAEPIVTNGTSPVRIEDRDYARTLWVGKEGFQWEKVYWAPGTKEETVVLRSTGAVDILLKGGTFESGPYELRLARNSSRLAAWTRIMSDGMFSLIHCGAGPARLFLQQRTAGGLVALVEREILVESGTIQRVVLDLSMEEERAFGGLDVVIALPDQGMRLFDNIAISIQPFFDDRSGPSQRINHLVRNLKLDSDGTRRGKFRNLPEGEYRITIVPGGVSTVATVRPSGTVKVELDVSKLSDVTVRPKRTSGLSHGEMMERPGDLLWRLRPLGQEDSEQFSDQHYGEFNRLPAFWNDGAWHLFCLPGTLTAVVQGPDGSETGRAQSWAIHGGRDEVEIRVDTTGGQRIDFVVHGAPSDAGFVVHQQLSGGIRSAPGGGVVELVRVQGAYLRDKHNGFTAKVYVSAPGSYALDFLSEPGTPLTTRGQTTVKVATGKSTQVELWWRDTVSAQFPPERK